MSLTIVIETIPHSDQRYPTVGDWEWVNQGETLLVRVSNMDDWRKEALIAWHELKEALLCRHAGITTEQVDAFDKTYNGEGEPGEDSGAPYHAQHMSAYASEIALTVELGVDWNDYVNTVESL